MAKKRKRKALTVHSAGHKVLVRNRKALHDYTIENSYEAGCSLVGSEVKSLRDSRASLTEAYAQVRNGEVWLVGARIDEYPWSHQLNHDPMRDRRLLLHQREIKRIGVKTEQRGYTLIPLSFYLKEGRIKLEVGLGVGKRLYEKRESKREAEAEREIARAAVRRR